MKRPTRKIKRQPSTKRLHKYATDLDHWFSSDGRVFFWRSKDLGVYELILAEVLLQRTRAESVAYLLPAFLAKYPSWEAITNATLEDLEHYIRPLGLWKRRAQTLLNLATEMQKRRGELPIERSEIESLPGVGQYIANAIELVCLHRSRPLLDTNMARCLERYFGKRQLADIRDDLYLQRLAQRYVDSGDTRRLNWAILDLGALICLPRSPKCYDCPVRSGCRWRRLMT